MNLLFRIILGIHITGIVIMAGTTMIDYLTYKTFWKLADAGAPHAVGIIPLMARYGVFIRAGAFTIFLTGTALLALEKGAAWAQPWFKVKVVLVLPLLLNGILIGNKQGHKLRETVTAHTPDFLAYTSSIRESMDRFYPIQLSLFFLTIIVSMIRVDPAIKI
ncbi:hypothetical protein [Chitinophaga sp.]|uniref:hypothetical protein n=1 Tax=Chitinophaga sp. TaxID=1869181 RepID=UPI002C526697|nr:hypothetical protein [Chitinophaga sp.]HWV69330.1 hypothetical protein [Chitinophaga sp.]